MEERKRWYMRVMKMKADQAMERVLREFKLFLSKDAEDGDEDPLNITAELESLVHEPNNEVTEDDLTETFRFFKKFRRELVYVFPMQTSHKCRYSTGTHLTHLRAREAPEPKDFWTANTERLTNISSAQLLEGFYTPEEEAEIIQFEKHAMMHPASTQADQRNFGITNFVQSGAYIWRPTSPAESSDEFDFEMDDYEYDWDQEVNTLEDLANQARPQVNNL